MEEKEPWERQQEQSLSKDSSKEDCGRQPAPEGRDGPRIAIDFCSEESAKTLPAPLPTSSPAPLPPGLLLAGFQRQALNGRYLRRDAVQDRINDREVYLHEGRKSAILYYCRRQDDWRITNSRSSAMKGMGLARAPRHVEILNASLGSGWQEWEAEVMKWVKRPKAGVTELELHSDLSFRIKDDDLYCLRDNLHLMSRFYEGLHFIIGDWADVNDEEEDVEVVVDQDNGKVQVKIMPFDLGALRYGRNHERLAMDVESLKKDIHSHLRSLLQAEGHARNDDDDDVSPERSVENTSKVKEFFVGHRDGWLMSFSSVMPLLEEAMEQHAPTLRRTASTGSTRAEPGCQGPSRSSSVPSIQRAASSSAFRGQSASPRCAARGALASFKAFLFDRLPNAAVAWRTLLDPGHKGFMLRRDFYKLCRQLRFDGNSKDVWEEMDVDGTNRVTLAQLDFDTATALGKFLVSLETRFGSLGDALQQLGLTGGRRYPRAEFVQRLQASALTGRDAAGQLFLMLAESRWIEDTANSRKQAAVTSHGLTWLGKMAPWLPRPAGRVRPGVLFSEQQAQGPAGGAEHGLSDSEDSAHGGVSGGSDREFEGPRRVNAQSRFDQLHEHAIGFHSRRAMRERQREKPQVKRGLARGGYAPGRTECLHLDFHRRKEQREWMVNRAEEEAWRLAARGASGRSDPESFQRLVTPMVRPERVEEPPGPRKALPAAVLCEKAEKMHQAAATREARLKQLVKHYEAEQEKEFESHKPKVTPGARFTEATVQRLHDMEVHKRTHKLEARKQEVQKQEAEQIAMAVPRKFRSSGWKPSATEVSDRLHYDHYCRQERLQREVQRQEEELGNTSRRRPSFSPSKREVFDRLFTSYGRHLGPNNGKRAAPGVQDPSPSSVDAEEGPWEFLDRPPSPKAPDDKCCEDFFREVWNYEPGFLRSTRDARTKARKDEAHAEMERLREAKAMRQALMSHHDGVYVGVVPDFSPSGHGWTDRTRRPSGPETMLLEALSEGSAELAPPSRRQSLQPG